MSWQGYIDSSLLQSKAVAAASIHGLDGNAWARSPNFNTTPEEVKKIIAEMAKDVPQEFYMHGFKVNGLKYTFLKKTADGVYGRGSDGHSGVCVCRTGKCMIVAVYEKGMQPGSCNNVVEKLAAFLRESNY